MPEFVIRTEALTKKFGSQSALNEVTVQVPPGPIGLLGPNGAGKSTTMKMLTGYLAPSVGTARVCGMEVAGNRDEVANRIGYLPQL